MTSTMDRSFIDADVATVAEQLTPEEAMALLGAPSWWETNKIERLNIPSIRMSDGPNGVRGNSHFKSTPAQVFSISKYIKFNFIGII